MLERVGAGSCGERGLVRGESGAHAVSAYLGVSDGGSLIQSLGASSQDFWGGGLGQGGSGWRRPIRFPSQRGSTGFLEGPDFGASPLKPEDSGPLTCRRRSGVPGMPPALRHGCRTAAAPSLAQHAPLPQRRPRHTSSLTAHAACLSEPLAAVRH